MGAFQSLINPCDKKRRLYASTFIAYRQHRPCVRGNGIGGDHKIQCDTHGDILSAAQHFHGLGGRQAFRSTPRHMRSPTTRLSRGFASTATAAHIHGPAAVGKNAGVVVLLGNNPISPIHGTAKLTPEQEQQLTAGLYDVNVIPRTTPAAPFVAS
jgi:CHRD domain